MAAADLYKMDSSDIQVSNCFPARRLFQLNKQGAGHWLAPHNTVQEKRFRAMVCSTSAQETNRPEKTKTLIPCRTLIGFTNTTSEIQDIVLDGSFLRKTHHVEKASDLCSVDVSDRSLTLAKEDDFLQFNCVAYINAAENLLSLEAFRTFNALRELDLSMNAIRRISIKPGDFPHLEVLDLSCNNLSADDIPQLGVLPNLRVLHLTGNGLTRLPPDMSDMHEKYPDIPMFPSLEILMLDDNNLSDSSLFVSLANLRSLRQLNLDKNSICEIPYLHQIELPDFLESPSVGKGESAEVLSRRIQQENEKEQCKEGLQKKKEEKLDYMVLQNTEDPDRTDVVFDSCLAKNVSSLNLPNVTITSKLKSSIKQSLTQLSQTFSPPLPSMRLLSLANNKIVYEEGLLPAALFPSLETLVIHGNPLTTLRRGGSTLLKSFLQQQLKIKIIQSRSPGTEKPHIYIPIRETRKVKTHVPKIPKQPLMLESTFSAFIDFPFDRNGLIGNGRESLTPSSPLPPIKSSSAEHINSSSDMTQEDPFIGEEDSFSTHPGVESVFMTQVDDFPYATRRSSTESISQSSDIQVETAKEEIVRPEIPEKFRGYEELFNVKTDPEFIEPVGIQSNVKALEYALKHLLVYRDTKPRLHGMQKPYMARESKFGKQLAPAPGKSKKQILQEVLTSMREPRNLTHTQLDSFLQKSKSSSEYKEANQLLKDLRRRYRVFHGESAERAIALEANLLQTASEIRGAERRLAMMQSKVKAMKEKYRSPE